VCPMLSLVSPIRLSVLAKLYPRRVINQILALVDSIRPLLNPLARHASIAARWLVIFRATSTDSGRRQRRA